MDHLDQITFWTAFGAAEISGIILVILMGYWTGVTRGGFAWQEDPGKQFNWHPLLITLGLIYFYGNGMMLYRVFRDGQKKEVENFACHYHDGVICVDGYCPKSRIRFA